jgi:hypothetical protein
VLEYKNGLAVSYLMLGDLYMKQQNNAEAKPYYQHGQRLLQDINIATPGILIVETNLDYVNEQLAQI